MEIGGTRLVFPLLAFSRGDPLRSVGEPEALLSAPRRDLGWYARLTLVDSAGVVFEIRGAVPCPSPAGRFRSALGFFGVRLRLRFLAAWRSGHLSLAEAKARAARSVGEAPSDDATRPGGAAEALRRIEAAQSIRELAEGF